MVRASKELVVGGEGGEDRISQIPDEILHSILFGLRSPEEAAKACVLSRRWLQLWRSYPHVDFELSEENQGQFHSFATSTCRRLPLPLSSDSEHSTSSSSCAAVAAEIEGFRISLHDDFQKEDLDQLLLLITGTNGASPVKFVLDISDFELHPCYSLPVPNWSRTKLIMLIGCDLTPTSRFGVRDGHNRNVGSLGSLEYLRLEDVSLSEQLIQSLLANAPRLVQLSFSRVFGIDRLEVASSPSLTTLALYNVYRVGRPGSDKMRKLRISSPKLQELCMGSLQLEELEIDAPNLVSLSWSVHDGPLTNVNVVDLASNCESSIRVNPGFTPQWLKLSLSTTFAKFRHLSLVFSSYFCLSEQAPLDLCQDASPPPTVDQVRYEPWLGVSDTEEAEAILESLFWVCRPKFMSITKGLIKYEDLIPECLCQAYLKTDSPNGVNATASWRHHLKDMKIQNDVTGEMMEISEDVIPSLAEREEVRFMLTWR